MKPTVILVSPKYGRNMGSVARAMANFSLENLYLVKPRGKALGKLARMWASGAESILQKARSFPSLKEATSAFSFVVGTTSLRGRKIRQPVYPLRYFANTVMESVACAPWALVFGPEDRGLSNTERSLCTHLITIETGSHHPVLNLAQSAVVCFYTLSPFWGIKNKFPMPAKQKELQGLYSHLQETLLTLGFLELYNPTRIMRDIQTMVGRAGLTSREVRILRGIFRKLGWLGKKLQETPQSGDPLISRDAVTDKEKST